MGRGSEAGSAFNRCSEPWRRRARRRGGPPGTLRLCDSCAYAATGSTNRPTCHDERRGYCTSDHDGRTGEQHDGSGKPLCARACEPQLGLPLVEPSAAKNRPRVQPYKQASSSGFPPFVIIDARSRRTHQTCIPLPGNCSEPTPVSGHSRNSYYFRVVSNPPS